MRFVFFVEGATEQRGIAGFLQRYLNARLNENVGIKVVGFTGGMIWSTTYLRKPADFWMIRFAATK